MDFNQLGLVAAALASSLAAIGAFLFIANRSDHIRRWWRRRG